MDEDTKKIEDKEDITQRGIIALGSRNSRMIRVQRKDLRPLTRVLRVRIFIRYENFKKRSSNRSEKVTRN